MDRDDTIITESKHITVSFNPTDTNSATKSTEFEITIKYWKGYQELTYKINRLWVEDEELNSFEKQLIEERALLQDMSQYAIIELTKQKGYETLTINPKQTRMSGEGKELFIQCEIEEGFMLALMKSIKEYPKWW